MYYTLLTKMLNIVFQFINTGKGSVTFVDLMQAVP